MRPMLVMLCLATALLWGCSDDTAVKGDRGTRDSSSSSFDKGVSDGGPAKSDGTKSDGSGGCQYSGKKVETYIPASGEASGWVEDTSLGKPGVEAGYTKADIEALIDGHQDPYDAAGCNGYAREYYKKGSFKLGLQLWDMKTVAAARTLFTTNKTNDEKNSGLTFSVVPNAPDQAVIADDKPNWKVWGQKCNYIYEIDSDYAGQAAAAKPEVISFVQYLAGKKLP